MGAGLVVLACAVAIATAATPVAATAAADGDGGASSDRAASRSWSPFLGEQRAVDAVDPRRVVVRFDDPSLGEWVAAQRGVTKLDGAARAAWLARAGKVQQRRINALAAAGVRFRIEHRYLRVLNGVSIMVQGDGAQLLGAVRGVAAVTPVRTVWPAALADDGAAGAAAAAGAEPSPSSSTHDAAVRVAVLDSGVNAAHPAVAGRVLDALDATRTDAAAKPRGANTKIAADAHGTAVAGAVLAGAGTDADADVRILPIRVLEQRPARDGVDTLLGDSDDLLAGLERAVDPDGNARTDDAAQVAVVASTSPYAGFAGSPEDHAVEGADALGTVVVAAAGNDGASGDDVGTIGSVAASRSALSIGAVDLRGKIDAAAVRVHGDGVDETFADAPVLTTGDEKLPSGNNAIVVVTAAGDSVEDYLDAQLRSRVSGAVALVATRDGVSVAKQVRAAADAGALAVLVGSDDAGAAAGTIDVRGADIPAIALDRADARELRDALADGRALAVSFDAMRIDNPSFGTVAGFSSGGPRLDGAGRPDALAPGVGMLVAGDGDSWHRVSGTSIAAAWAAGQAAAVRAAHPELDAADVRALLMGSAISLGTVGDRPDVALQGAGVLDSKHALAASELAAGGRIDFGSVAPGATASRDLVVRGLDGAVVEADALRLDDGGRAARGTTLTLRDGSLVLTAADDAEEGHVGGWLVLDGGKLRIPWTATIRDSAAQIVPLRAELSSRTLRRVAGPNAYSGTLQLRIGGEGNGDRLGLSAIERLEVRLFDATGKDHGTIGALTQALPGVYTFGISGVDNAGKQLAPGVWQLKVRYVPATDPDGAWREGPSATFAMAAARAAKN